MTPAELAVIHAAAFTVPRPWSEREFADLMASPHVFVTIRPGAFAMGRVIADEAELLTIAAHPDHRRQGLGLLCLQSFSEIARDRGAASAFLEVAADNAPAIALYLRDGWVRSGLRRGYYHAPEGPAIDAQILSKSFT